MAETEIVGRKPRLWALVFRILFLSLLATLLAFAVGLFVGIVATVLAGAARGAHPDMSYAYRHVAFPLAVGVAAVALIAMSVHEVRRYLRRIALWRGF
jgi:ABC-type proline/glycine betaine transport system permease subunit